MTLRQIQSSRPVEFVPGVGGLSLNGLVHLAHFPIRLDQLTEDGLLVLFREPLRPLWHAVFKRMADPFPGSGPDVLAGSLVVLVNLGGAVLHRAEASCSWEPNPLAAMRARMSCDRLAFSNSCE